jgi:hypothetical protein
MSVSPLRGRTGRGFLELFNPHPKRHRKKVKGGRNSDLVLGHVITSFPAVSAVVLTILGESEVVVGLAERAVFVAHAALFGLVADDALKFLVGHIAKASLSRIQSLLLYFAGLTGQNQTMPVCRATPGDESI